VGEERQAGIHEGRRMRLLREGLSHRLIGVEGPHPQHVDNVPGENRSHGHAAPGRGKGPTKDPLTPNLPGLKRWMEQLGHPRAEASIFAKVCPSGSGKSIRLAPRLPLRRPGRTAPPPEPSQALVEAPPL
jgi:hypothetical protein